jgi:hypothetical protein
MLCTKVIPRTIIIVIIITIIGSFREFKIT